MLLVQIGQSFSSLRHRNFKRFISGQSISLIGTWLQNIAQPWLVLEITGSPFLLGIVVASQTLPQMLFSFFAGSLIDRLPKKRILLATQSILMLLALILSFLVFMKWIQFWHVLAIALLFGTTNAIDMPARQAYMIELVGKKDLTNAIGINSTIFNLARVIGPAIGGVLIASFGIATCFLINGLSYIAVIYQLALIDTPFNILVKESMNIKILFKDMVDGIRYVVQNKKMRNIFSLFFVVGIFALNFSVLNPVLAKTDFNMGAEGLSILMACMGAGALSGALMVILIKTKKPSTNLIFLLAIFFALSQIFLGLSVSFFMACICIIFTGLFMVLLSTLVNSSMQLETADEFRGRVVSFYIFVFVGVAPIGSVYSGYLSSMYGAKPSYFISGCIVLIASILIWFKAKEKQDLIQLFQISRKMICYILLNEKTWETFDVKKNVWHSISFAGKAD